MKKVWILAAMTAMLMLTASFAWAAGAQISRHRAGVNLGAYVPTGKYDDLKYQVGGTFGVDYRYLFTTNWGVGGFIDCRAFSSEEKSGWEVDVSTAIFGASLLYEHRLADRITLYGAGKLGIAATTVEYKWSYSEYHSYGNGHYTYQSGSGSKTDSGNALAGILEAGARYQINKLIDVGGALKYTLLSQKVDGAKNTNLGGLSVVAQVGFNF